jgi:hypothetical protein
MKQQKNSAVLLVTMLFVSVVLLSWSVISTWRATGDGGNSGIEIANAEGLPSSVSSNEAKASLFYPAMKSRGPLAGGKLMAKPLAATQSN